MGGYGHHHHHHHHAAAAAAAAYRAGMSQRLGGRPSGGPSRHSMMDYTSASAAYRGAPTQAPGLLGAPHSTAAGLPPPPQATPYTDAPSSSHHLTSLTALLNSSTAVGCCKFEEEMDTSISLLGGTGMAPPCVTLDEVSYCFIIFLTSFTKSLSSTSEFLHSATGSGTIFFPNV